MTTSTRRFLTAAVLAVAGVGAYAATPLPVAHPSPAAAFHRDAAQDARVLAGLHRQAASLERLRTASLRDGRLSRNERARLDTAQSQLQRDLRVAVARGQVDRREASRLERSLTPVGYHQHVTLPRR